MPDRELIGEMIAESIAVAIIIIFGCCVAAMIVLYDPNPYKTAYWGVCITWGLGVMIAIYVTGSISGTHANPAVTLAFTIFRGFPIRKVLPYCGAQVVGAFIGAVVVYALYYNVIDHYNSVNHLTRAGGGAAGVFFTAPGLAVTPFKAFLDEIILTAILVFVIFAVTDEHNGNAPQANSGALVIGLTVAAIGAMAGNLESWAINPARDFGPRVFAWLMGWNGSAFPGNPSYWWGPIAGPLLGGVIGGALEHILVRPYFPRMASDHGPVGLIVPEPESA